MEKALEELQGMKSFRISWLGLGLVHEFKEAGLFSSLGALTNFSLKIPNIFAFVNELVTFSKKCANINMVLTAKWTWQNYQLLDNNKW